MTQTIEQLTARVRELEKQRDELNRSANLTKRLCVEMKEYNEQVVETLDDAGCIIANKNIIIDNLQARVALISQERNGYMEAADRACDERDEFKAKVAELEKENDTLRRIHKESIDILVKELSDKDYEYNQKTNRLIERHAEQLNRCDAEVKRLTGRKDGEVPNY